MTHQEKERINKFICEEIEKKCWHEVTIIDGRLPLVMYRCDKCQLVNTVSIKVLYDKLNPNYFSDSEYLPFIHRCQKEKWWDSDEGFIAHLIPPYIYPVGLLAFTFDPNQLLPALVGWWKEEK